VVGEIKVRATAKEIAIVFLFILKLQVFEVESCQIKKRKLF
jgi:hypothetical protein